MTGLRERLSASATDADAAAVKADPNNHYYWRRNSTRMESEVIRDSLLHLAGALDPTLGGPTIDPKREEYANGRLAWIYDPDGNKIELWEPANSDK